MAPTRVPNRNSIGLTWAKNRIDGTSRAITMPMVIAIVNQAASLRM